MVVVKFGMNTLAQKIQLPKKIAVASLTLVHNLLLRKDFFMKEKTQEIIGW